RRARAEEVRPTSQMRTEDPHPRSQDVVDPELDGLGGHPERWTTAAYVRRDGGVCLVAGQRHLHGSVTCQLEAANGTVFRHVPACPDCRPVEPLVGGVLDNIANEVLHRVRGEDGRLRETQLEVMDHRRRIPHELALGRLHGWYATRE